MGKYKYWFFVTNATDDYKDKIGSCIGCPHKQEELTVVNNNFEIKTIVWGFYLGRTETSLSDEETNKKLDEFKSNNVEYLKFKLKQKEEEQK